MVQNKTSADTFIKFNSPRVPALQLFPTPLPPFLFPERLVSVLFEICADNSYLAYYFTMKKKKIEIEFFEAVTTEGLSPLEVRMISKAKSAAKKAYAPYSGYSVGAAVLLQNGEIITGSNQENAAYPSGICAERTALYYAGSSFPDVPVKTIVITAFYKNEFVRMPVTPCGACRQVILETQQRYRSPVRIIMYGEELIRIIEDVHYLLPFPFSKTGEG